LCGTMMAAEIVGGLLWGSMALIADGLHMSTHAGALVIAAFAYAYARRHARDERLSSAPASSAISPPFPALSCWR
jgi:Co/Zn/Cd efflux system component